MQEALVEWEGVGADDATWERFEELKNQFPHLNLEDKIRLQGEGNVMIQTTTIDQLMRVTTLGLSTCTSVFAKTQDKDKAVVVGVKDQE